MQRESGIAPAPKLSKEEQQKRINPEGRPGSPAGQAVASGFDLLERLFDGRFFSGTEEKPQFIDPIHQAKTDEIKRSYVTGEPTRGDGIDEGGLPRLSQQDYRSLEKTVDPKNEMDANERNIQIYKTTQEFWLERGKPQKAAEAALALNLYNKKFTQTAGLMAQAAFDDGNIQVGLDWMKKAYDHVPNNRSLEAKVNPDGTVAYQVVDHTTNKVVDEGVAGPKELGALAKQVQTGVMFDQEANRIAQEIKLGYRPKETVKGPSEGELKRVDNREVQAAVEAGVEAGKAGKADDFNKAVRTVRERLGQSTDADRTIKQMYLDAGQPLPKSLEGLDEKAATQTDRDRAARKAEVDGIKKEIADADAAKDPKRAMRARTKLADDAYTQVKEDQSVDQTRLDTSIPDDATDDDRDFLNDVGFQILRKNRMSPKVAVKFITAATDPKNGMNIGEDGRLTVRNFPTPVLVSSDILAAIAQRRAAAAQPAP